MGRNRKRKVESDYCIGTIVVAGTNVGAEIGVAEGVIEGVIRGILGDRVWLEVAAIIVCR